MYGIKLHCGEAHAASPGEIKEHKESQHAEVKIQNEKFLYLKYS